MAQASWAQMPDLGNSYQDYLNNYNSWFDNMNQTDQIRARHSGFGNPYAENVWQHHTGIASGPNMNSPSGSGIDSWDNMYGPAPAPQQTTTAPPPQQQPQTTPAPYPQQEPQPWTLTPREEVVPPDPTDQGSDFYSFGGSHADLGNSYEEYLKNHEFWFDNMSQTDQIRAGHGGFANPYAENVWQHHIDMASEPNMNSPEGTGFPLWDAKYGPPPQGSTPAPVTAPGTPGSPGGQGPGSPGGQGPGVFPVPGSGPGYGGGSSPGVPDGSSGSNFTIGSGQVRPFLASGPNPGSAGRLSDSQMNDWLQGINGRPGSPYSV